MKKIAIIIISAFTFLGMSAQDTGVPDIFLRNLDGAPVSSRDVIKYGSPTLVVLWNSSSAKCCENLENINEAWQEVLKDSGVHMVALCEDGNGSWSYVKPIVDGQSWEFDCYIDVNGDFKRAMCLSEGPCALLFDSDQNLVCRFNSGCASSQELLCDNVLKSLATADKSFVFHRNQK